MIHFNTVLPFKPRSYELFSFTFPHKNPVYMYIFAPHTCHMDRLSRSSWFDHSRNENLELVIIQFSPAPYYSPPLILYQFLCRFSNTITYFHGCPLPLSSRFLSYTIISNTHKQWCFFHRIIYWNITVTIPLCNCTQILITFEFPLYHFLYVQSNVGNKFICKSKWFLSFVLHPFFLEVARTAALGCIHGPWSNKHQHVIISCDTREKPGWCSQRNTQATGGETEESWFDSRQVQQIFLF